MRIVYFTVGDKVKISDFRYLSNKESILEGRIGTIETIYNTGACKVAFPSGEIVTLNEMYLELHKESFTKSDLKDGMKVIYRDGEKRYVIDNRLIGVSDDGDLYYAGNTGWFYDDLTAKNYDSMDIMEIYYMDELIWKREEDSQLVEISIEEIAKLKGVDKSLIRIKE